MNSVRVVNGVLLPGCLVAAVIDGRQSETRFPEVPRNVARGTCRPRLTQTTTIRSQLPFHICLPRVHLLSAESASAVENCFSSTLQPLSLLDMNTSAKRPLHTTTPTP
jgi:hypothetical protein